jgi:FAD/FMN-containing dehydrogenase
VKCGGHSYAGKSTCNDGMQIDLSTLRHCRVDPVARSAYVAGGSLLAALDGVTHGCRRTHARRWLRQACAALWSGT